MILFFFFLFSLLSKKKFTRVAKSEQTLVLEVFSEFSLDSILSVTQHRTRGLSWIMLQSYGFISWPPVLIISTLCLRTHVLSVMLNTLVVLSFLVLSSQVKYSVEGLVHLFSTCEQW